MANITVKSKENRVSIVLPTNVTLTGSKQDDFTASASATAGKIHIKRLDDDKYIVYNLDYTSVKDVSGTTIGTDAASCVSELNSSYFQVPETVSVKTRFVGSKSAGEYLGGSRIANTLFTSGSLTAGSVYVLGATQLSLADADVVSLSTGLACVATDAAVASEVLIEGAIKLNSNSEFSSSSKGDVLYFSTSPGLLTSTAPSASGDVVRVAGYVLDPANGYVYFNPSQDWIEL